MITLCTQCLPDDKPREVYTMIPLTGCEECGVYDKRYKGGPTVHGYRVDPRIKDEEI